MNYSNMNYLEDSQRRNRLFTDFYERKLEITA